MIPPVDLFRVERDGSVCWIEAIADLESAKARVQILGTSCPGEYLILSHRTGNKISVKIEKPKTEILRSIASIW